MDHFIRCFIEPKSLEKMERVLLSLEMEPLWTSESENELEWGLPYSAETKKLLQERSIPFEELSSSSIDWDSQWASFAKGTAIDGVYEIAFKELGMKTEGSFFLKAGPGFGDLSHPTTQLMLQLMESFCKGRNCVDIGSGSGILTIAALQLGARQVEACDIDEAAVLHTQKNIALNHFDDRAHACTPEEMWKRIDAHPLDHPLILINMIESEQREALREFFLRKIPSCTLLASGVLREEEEKYCRWVESFGLRLDFSIGSGEWSAAVFHRL